MKRPNNKTIDFAREAGFDSVEFYTTYNNEDVFVAENDGEITFTGYPAFIINTHNPRFSTVNETYEIMGIEFIQSTKGEFL